VEKQHGNLMKPWLKIRGDVDILSILYKNIENAEFQNSKWL